ncbi:hypothetical protein FRC03_012629 [Tulasnella sp. 419]|nr:hypothetical protein FRC03_012629 [Tulasnella sp. 419]
MCLIPTRSRTLDPGDQQQLKHHNHQINALQHNTHLRDQDSVMMMYADVSNRIMAFYISRSLSTTWLVPEMDQLFSYFRNGKNRKEFCVGAWFSGHYPAIHFPLLTALFAHYPDCH